MTTGCGSLPAPIANSPLRRLSRRCPSRLTRAGGAGASSPTAGHAYVRWPRGCRRLGRVRIVVRAWTDGVLHGRVPSQPPIHVVVLAKRLAEGKIHLVRSRPLRHRQHMLVQVHRRADH